jgi:hypothetical protein
MQILQEDKARRIEAICLQHSVRGVVESTCRAGFIASPDPFRMKHIDRDGYSENAHEENQASQSFRPGHKKFVNRRIETGCQKSTCNSPKAGLTIECGDR